MGSSLLDLGPERLLKLFVTIPGLFLMVFVAQKHTSSNFFWSAGVTVGVGRMCSGVLARCFFFFSQLAPTLMLASRFYFFFQAEYCAASKRGEGGDQLIHLGCRWFFVSCTPMQSHSAAFGFLQTGSISILSRQRRLRSTSFTLRRPEHTGRLQRFKQTQSTTTTKIQFNRENKQSRSRDTRVMNT